MVWEWLIKFLTEQLTALAGTISPLVPGVPGWMGSVEEWTATLQDAASSTAGWVPWDVVGASIALSVAVGLVSVLIHLTRMIVSHVTGGGGAA